MDAETIRKNINGSNERIKKYKDILEELANIQNEATSLTNLDIMDEVEVYRTKLKEIAEEGCPTDRVGCVSEILISSIAWNELTKVAGCVTLRLDSTFSDQAFLIGINKLMSNAENMENKWLALTDFAMAFAKAPYYKPSMLSATHAEVPSDVVQRKKIREISKSAVQTRPEQLNSLKSEDKGHLKLKLLHRQLLGILQNSSNKAVPYYYLITHPTNLMISADNALQLAHLAKATNIVLYRDETNELWLKIDKNSTKKRVSFTISLSEDICQQAVEKYNITEPLLNLNAEVN